MQLGILILCCLSFINLKTYLYRTYILLASLCTCMSTCYNNGYKGIQTFSTNTCQNRYGQLQQVILSSQYMSLLIYEKFCSISRHVKKITGDLQLIFHNYFIHITWKSGKKTVKQRAHKIRLTFSTYRYKIQV